MFCRNCGTQLDDRAAACVKCGLAPRSGTTYCHACGKDTLPGAVICTGCGVSLAMPAVGPVPGADKKLTAGLCAILIGSLGIHKFILGYTVPGVIMLVVTVGTCGWGGIVMGIIGIIEGIIYLTRSDEEFVRTYVQSQRQWF